MSPVQISLVPPNRSPGAGLALGLNVCEHQGFLVTSRGTEPICPVFTDRFWYAVSSLKKGQVPMDASSDRPIVHVAASSEIGSELARVLGLCDSGPLLEFSLVFKSGEPVEVIATYLVREADGETILRELTKRRYQLQPMPEAGTDIDRRAAAEEGA
jgi:hypothetical protein